jgi:HEAT repeat protein
MPPKIHRRVGWVASLWLGLACITGAASAAPPADKEQEAKLIAVLAKSDASLKDKADACRVLALVGTRECVAPLAGLLGDEKLSHLARYALEPNPDSAVDEAFRSALPKLNGRPLVGVIGSLGVRRDTKAVEPIAVFLKAADPAVAKAAARSLGRIGVAPAAEALQKNLDGTSPAVRLAVSEGLFRCAEHLVADGKTAEALVIYDWLDRPNSPVQVRTSAVRKARALRQVAAAGL